MIIRKKIWEYKNEKYLTVADLALCLTSCTEQTETRCVYLSCWDGALQYTVSEAVETIYKNTTYTTVYEPKTYATTTYKKCKYCGK